MGELKWDNGSFTGIAGRNTDVLKHVLTVMMQWCEDKKYDYITYNIDEDFYYIDEYLKTCTVDEIAFACIILCTFSYDFDQDVTLWMDKCKKPYNTKLNILDEFIDNVDILKRVLILSGSGYARLFIMIVTGLKNPNATYYFLHLPETSLHVLLVEKLISLLLRVFPQMKIVFSSNDAENICVRTDGPSWDTSTKLINLPY
jgi:hypothetical protein